MAGLEAVLTSAAGTVPGAAAALISRGRVAEFATIGRCCADDKGPLTVDTQFEAASLAKPIFALAVLELATEGRLDLTRPLADVRAPDSPDERAGRITALHVLSHTTGLPNWRPTGGPLQPRAEPGAAFGYSGEGFIALQHVVESITGASLEAFVRARVFGLLGMTSASYVKPDRRHAHTCGHDEAGAPLDRTFGQGMAEGGAAGGLLASLRDLAIFAAELARPARFPRAVALLRGRRVDAGTDVGWGLGIGLQETASGSWLWQWGANAGYRHYLAVRPRTGDALVVLTNGEAGLATCEQVAEAMFEETHPAFAFLRDRDD